MQGNPYKDEKGHFTSEQNDGGKCQHEKGIGYKKLDKEVLVKNNYQDNSIDDNYKKETYFDHSAVFDKKVKDLGNKPQEEAIKRMLNQSEASKFITPDQFNFFKNLFGENPNPDSIKDYLKEQRRKQQKNEEEIPSTINIITPERQAQREEWVKQEIERQELKRPIQHNKIAYISIGDAGTGKSSAGGKLFKNQFGAYEIDPDIFKTDYIPESKKDPNMIGVVHTESSVLGDKVYEHAINTGANIFYPTTASNYEKIEKKLEKLKDNGYEIYVDYIGIDLGEEITRTMTRALGEGRYTDLSVIRRSYGKSRDNFDQLIAERSDLISGWRDVDNTYGPNVIDKGGKDIFEGKGGKKYD